MQASDNIHPGAVFNGCQRNASLICSAVDANKKSLEHFEKIKYSYLSTVFIGTILLQSYVFRYLFNVESSKPLNS